ncbi:hypothetical protein C3747_1g1799c [Trypanosoma cruzi]|uniref:Uncharacterized protein n=1 Tax=Trypanosoma cruzi TaxID=5693 RepID=A0A2V2XR32_TRYCR|nr:hypothetical protein C3747_1g1799c [Trypanosoma cruzi]
MPGRTRSRQCCGRCVCGCGCCRLLCAAHDAREEEKRRRDVQRAQNKWHPLDVPKMGQAARRFMNEEQRNTRDAAITLRMRFMY